MAFLIPILAVVIAYPFFQVAYNLFFHPLRSFPGPLANRATVLPKIYNLLAGRLPFHVTDIHRRYGPVVRIAPGELAFTDPQAWKDIYTRKGRGQYELPQDQHMYNALGEKSNSLLSAEPEEHDAMRRLLSPGFSDRAMRAQEPVVGGYVDLLMQRLTERCTSKDGVPQAINMRDWMNFTTFDIIGRLGFGSDFACLEKGTYHPWIDLIIHSLWDIAFLQSLKALGILTAVSKLMKALKVGDAKRQLHMELTTSKVKQRVAMGTGIDDFVDGFIKSGMNIGQLIQNGGLLIIAGSETTATLLTGAIFFLATHPDVLEKLVQEVRGRYASEREITLTSVSDLSYMLAVLHESLRCYPPVAITAPRRVPAEGAEVAGHKIPADTVVGIWHWAMYHEPAHFTDPYHFDPERFLEGRGGGKYKDDRIDVVNPFLVGPRNCIGQNLAYAEMRLILARLVWKFDMTLEEKSKGYLDGQLIYLLWDKPDLNVYLEPFERYA